jgi:hypothetical protein
MKRLLLAFIFAAFCCSVMSQPVTQITESHNEAIEIAITDFLKCRLSKKSNVFSVGIYEKGEYDRYEIGNDLIVATIGPVENTDTVSWFDDVLDKEIAYHPYYVTLADTLGSTRLPTRHVIKDGKLFYWYDADYGLSEEMINVLLDYNLAERINVSDISYLGLIGKNQDFVDVADYYFCNNDPSNYKRVITNIATGWYKPPTIRCRRQR